MSARDPAGSRSRVSRRGIGGRISVGSTSVAVRLRQVRHQHVGDQIHARPALFEVVGDDRDAQDAHLATTRTIAISERRNRHNGSE